MPTKRTIQSLLLASLTVGFASPALADFKFYGHLNFGILHQDDGVSKKTFFADNNNSNSRIGVIWTLPETQLGVFSFNVEASLGATQSSAVSIPGGNNFKFDWDRRKIRKIDLKLVTSNAGTFYLGQGSMASDGVAYEDLSGTANISGAYIASTSGGQLFRTTAGALSTVSVGSGTADFDGGRRLRFRYDTPKFNGFTFSAAVGDEVLNTANKEDFQDVAIRYANNEAIKGFDVRAAVGYNWRSGGANFLGASAGLLHRSTGLNAHIAGGRNDVGANYGFLKLGVVKPWLGDDKKTALSIDFYSSNDVNGANTKLNSTAFSVAQYFGENLQVFGQYRMHDYEDTIVQYQKSDAIYVGARYNFSF